MLQVLFRAFVTVFTVATGVTVSTLWGDSSGGKLLAASVIAVVVGLVEWLMIWTPKHSALARRLLDPRSVVVGVWLQDVKLAWGLQGRPQASPNRFAIFTVSYDSTHDYLVEGRAYDERGQEYARWHSIESPMFSRNGRSMTYLFEGTVLDSDVSLTERHRVGLTRLALESSTDCGEGSVEHVAMNAHVEFDLFRITPTWLATRGLAAFSVEAIGHLATRSKFAEAYARTLQPVA
ncbi:hypothetical protein EV385_2113 [Krasilnikovia cinnamomea]|uniref:SMODS-associating 2TM beta-strand rich effector domain-containing protein n=1 Tax=Krasilnikovia cinnamomea TaxID=349313 RepID=A0A4Q7ZIP0_9ACTN|nr:hypothetical protein [Krasilnikovia cinnamomea]RZU50344.1 hypothetical protein EV385_2113 [Krasilnikovia cinnamomea]